MVARKTQECFQKEVQEIHPDLDFSQSVYLGGKKPVVVRCHIHGEFKKNPVALINKRRGCSKCTDGYHEKKTTKQWIEEAQTAHGNRYDYSRAKYTGAFDSIEIGCKEHGWFQQSAREHSNGSNCPECVGGVAKPFSYYLKKFIDQHGDKYEYDEGSFTNSHNPMRIKCYKHGWFEQAPWTHYKGQGCPGCAGVKRYTTETWIEKAREVHGDRYDYSQVNYTSTHSPVKIICREHGVFKQAPANHCSGKQGCPVCKNNQRHTTDEWIEKAREVHGDRYDYSQVNYTSTHSPVEIVCRAHGVFKQRPADHLRGKGCMKCGWLFGQSVNRLTVDEFIKRSKMIHGDRYDYSMVDYINTKTAVTIKCPDHGAFEQIPNSHITGHGCPSCGSHPRRMEAELKNLVASIYDGEIRRNDRTVIAPKEIDILLPDIKLAIEFCGLYWHSEAVGGKQRAYHLNKLESCEAQGYRLITIFEDEWLDRPDVVKTRLMTVMGTAIRGVGARKLNIRPITWKEAKAFFAQYHLQGSGSPGGIYYGGFENDQLVGAMMFGKARAALGAAGKTHYELLRFATDGKTYAGLGSRLFATFVRDHNPKMVISYADRRWSVGGLYKAIGFEQDASSNPNYWYFVAGSTERKHRYNFRKDVLIRSGGDPAKTEWEIMQERGYDRIWDCGNLKYTWTR